MKKLSAALAIAGVVASASASAQTTAVFDLTSGLFTNAYTFTIGTTSDLVGDTNSLGITWFGVLLQAPSLSYTSLDPNPDDGFSFTGLSAGTYALTFLGNGTGGYGGYYTITAVPEPSSAALALGALGLLALALGQARRQRQGVVPTSA